ncbi:hypothetical protein WOB16_004904, partial [Escherichia coli]
QDPDLVPSQNITGRELITCVDYNKKLAPLKLEILQAAGKMQLKLDEFIDCMDEMNKAVQKLKELTA